MKKLEENNEVKLFLGHFLLKNRKGMEEDKVEIPMVLEEDPSLEKVSSVIIATSQST